jgi:hypothetical protein
MRRATGNLTLTALLIVGSVGHAQRVSGVVRNAATTEPVVGALVTLVGTDSTFARTYTNRAGAFQVTAQPRVMRLQVKRIGFTPVDLDISSSIGGPDVRQVIIDLTPVPPILEASVSRASGMQALDALIADGSRCPRTEAAARALELWEQAQIGFVATAAVRLTDPPTVTAFRYVQRVRNSGIWDHTVHVVGGTALGTFAAHRSASEFASLGYVGVAGESLVFYGLDVNVLLERVFMLTHCFAIAAPQPSQPGRVGIAFIPAPGRESLIEVSGTVWLDRSPLALHALEFHYEGLGSRAKAAGSGGSIAFRTADNGVTMIDRWQLRLLEGIAVPPRAVGSARITRNMLEIPVGGPLNLTVEGAELQAARWRPADGTTVVRSFSTVQGTVLPSNGRAKAGLHVELVASPYRTVTDSAGRFAIPDVIAGPYTLIAYDTTWGSFGEMQRLDQRIEADGAKPVPLSLRIPARDTDASNRCTATFPGRGPAAIDVVLSGPGGLRPLLGAVDATVEVTVERDGRTRNPPLQHKATLGNTIRICGVYPGELTATVTTTGGRRGETKISIGAARVTTVEISVR